MTLSTTLLDQPVLVATSVSAKSTYHFDFLVRATCLGLLFTYVFFWRLYLPGFRIYTPAPIIFELARVPSLINWFVYIGSLASLIWLYAHPSRKTPACIIAACWLFWFLQDINRMQPFNLMYCYTLLMITFWYREKHIAQNALRIMVCGVYFWAGFHKLNLSFYAQVAPWFLEPIHHLGDPPYGLMDQLFINLIIFVPIYELLIGVLLLFPACRWLATYMAFIMLVVVLYCLGPLGHNWGASVWPWNVWLFLMEFCLFNTQNSKEKPALLFLKLHPTGILSVIIFMLAPIISIYNLQYTQLGFKLYSGNTVRGEILFPKEETFSRLPKYVKNLMPPLQHQKEVTWALATELHNAPYPAPEPMRIGAAGMCPYLDVPSKAVLRLTHPAPFYSLESKKVDTPLCPKPL